MFHLSEQKPEFCGQQTYTLPSLAVPWMQHGFEREQQPAVFLRLDRVGLAAWSGLGMLEMSSSGSCILDSSFSTVLFRGGWCYWVCQAQGGWGCWGTSSSAACILSTSVPRGLGMLRMLSLNSLRLLGTFSSAAPFLILPCPGGWRCWAGMLGMSSSATCVRNRAVTDIQLALFLVVAAHGCVLVFSLVHMSSPAACVRTSSALPALA